MYWIVIALITSNEPGSLISFELKDSSFIKPRFGGASHSFIVDNKTILTVDAKREINLWEFHKTAKVKLISSRLLEWSNWNFDYSKKNKIIAFANEKQNGIFFLGLISKTGLFR